MRRLAFALTLAAAAGCGRPSATSATHDPDALAPAPPEYVKWRLVENRTLAARHLLNHWEKDRPAADAASRAVAAKEAEMTAELEGIQKRLRDQYGETWHMKFLPDAAKSERYRQLTARSLMLADRAYMDATIALAAQQADLSDRRAKEARARLKMSPPPAHDWAAESAADERAMAAARQKAAVRCYDEVMAGVAQAETELGLR